MSEKIKCPFCGKEINLNKGKQSKKLKATGYQALQYNLGEDEVSVDFRFIGGLDGEDLENFSEQKILDYLATCYANSCLTLLSSLEKYTQTENLIEKRNIAYRYLPAMFCFRHFVELKLKGIYVEIKNEMPDFNHDLEKIKKIIEENLNKPLIAYQQALDFLEEKEKSSQTFFRYLSNKSKEFVDKIHFSMKETETVRKLISDINICSQDIKTDNHIRRG